MQKKANKGLRAKLQINSDKKNRVTLIFDIIPGFPKFDVNLNLSSDPKNNLLFSKLLMLSNIPKNNNIKKAKQKVIVKIFKFLNTNGPFNAQGIIKNE